MKWFFFTPLWWKINFIQQPTSEFFFFFLGDDERLVFAKKSKNQNLNCLLLFQNIKIDGDYVHKELKTFVVLVILSCLSFAVQMPILFSEFVASTFLHSQQLIFQVHELNKLWVLVNWYCISHLNRYLLSLIFLIIYFSVRLFILSEK